MKKLLLFIFVLIIVFSVLFYYFFGKSESSDLVNEAQNEYASVDETDMVDIPSDVYAISTYAMYDKDDNLEFCEYYLLKENDDYESEDMIFSSTTTCDTKIYMDAVDDESQYDVSKEIHPNSYLFAVMDETCVVYIDGEEKEYGENQQECVKIGLEYL